MIEENMKLMLFERPSQKLLNPTIVRAELLPVNIPQGLRTFR